MGLFCMVDPKAIEALDQKFRRRTSHCGVEICPKKNKKFANSKNIWCLELFLREIETRNGLVLHDRL